MPVCLYGSFRSRLAARFDDQLKLEVKIQGHCVAACGIEKLQFMDDTQQLERECDLNQCFQF